MTSDSVLQDLEDLMSRMPEYDLVEFQARVLKLLSIWHTDDYLIEVLDSSAERFEEWIDNYDPTPY